MVAINGLGISCNCAGKCWLIALFSVNACWRVLRLGKWVLIECTCMGHAQDDPE